MASQWSILPREIRLEIFEALVQGPGRTRNGNTSTKTGLSRYASVCKEWQAFFEKRIYGRLTLTSSCLEDFNLVVRRQRGLVEHIWLRIKLQTYDCSACMEFTDLQMSTNDDIISDAISKLFLILNTWNVHQVAFMGRLALEISLYSPSDSQHDFKGDLHLDNDHRLDMDPFSRESVESFPVHDPHHGWSNGHRSRPPTLAAISRLLVPTFPNFPGGLPSVAVVKELILRRETRRGLSVKALQQILKSLPNLEYIIHEPWRDFFRMNGQYIQDPGNLSFMYSFHETSIKILDFIGFVDIILTSLPATLKDFTLFEDFNEDYNVVFFNNYITWEWPQLPELIRTPSPSIGAALARRSIGLAKLSASYIADANDFFKACKSDWTWNNLTLLALTSRLLVSTTHYSIIRDMLVKAGTAALRMPKLQTMEIWNGTKQNACVFRYQTTPYCTTLSWRRTWDLELEDEVVNVWKKVSELYTRHELFVLEDLKMDERNITSHAAAIHELKLNEQVIHPVSLEQIQRESKRYFYPHRAELRVLEEMRDREVQEDLQHHNLLMALAVSLLTDTSRALALP